MEPCDDCGGGVYERDLETIETKTGRTLFICQPCFIEYSDDEWKERLEDLDNE